jgi:very-short-patch-repair endonuclease
MPRHHDPETTRRARELRRTMTEEERRLWWYLRDWFPNRWRRQEPIDRYITDFVSYRHALVVEVDGSQHIDSAYDQRRDAHLRRRGFRVLRFANWDVTAHIEDVMQTIAEAMEAPPSTR